MWFWVDAFPVILLLAIYNVLIWCCNKKYYLFNVLLVEIFGLGYDIVLCGQLRIGQI